MADIIIDPMCLLGISTYHTKNVSVSIGASYGILYALQKELTYKISMSAPIGTNTVTQHELVNRLIQFESLRLKKAKTTVNYYDEFILIGWYVMGTSKYLDDKIYSDQLNKAFSERGATYKLAIDATSKEEPKLFKEAKQVKYSASMDPLEKYCADSLYFQESKKQSTLVKSLNKQKHLLEIYNQKLGKLNEILQSTGNDEKKRQIMEILDMYERMEGSSISQKEKTIEAINYSVLSGLILSYQNLKRYD